MELEVACGFFYWLLLPLSLLSACLFRYTAFSLVYLLFLLLLPWFWGPNERSIQSHTGRLIQALLAISIIFVCAHIAFQTCLYVVPEFDAILGYNCSTWEILSRHIGVIRLDLDDIPNSARYVAPDLGIFLLSTITLALCNKLKVKKTVKGSGTEELLVQEGDDDGDPPESEDLNDEDVEYPEGEEPYKKPSRFTARMAKLRTVAQKLLKAMGKTLAIVLLALAGITVPSAFSGVYFILFIGICTWWACHLPLSHIGFNTICVMVSFFAAGHLICLYVYQTLYGQEVFPSDSLWARLFGLKEIIIIPSNCTKANKLILNENHEWPVYVNPGILLLLYFTVTSLLKMRNSDSSESIKKLDATSPYEPAASSSNGKEEVELSALEGSTRKGCTDGDETKSMLSSPIEIQEDGTDDCNVHVTNGSSHKDTAELETKDPAGSTQTSPLQMLGHVILKQSYICVLITMMVWSITYHSWLTFVLLLWSCLIWILRNRRTFALLCSPFILLYGISLCCLQYVWGMDLEPELPVRLGFMSLQQLGLLHRPYPCLHLGAMVIYSTFFILAVQYNLSFISSGILQQAEQLEDLGLEQFSVSELFTSILIPGFFLLACILQLHYFHRRFMKITDLEVQQFKDRHQSRRKARVHESQCERSASITEIEDDEVLREVSELEAVDSEDEAVPSKWGLVVDRLLVLLKKFFAALNIIETFLWRLLELHVVKLVAICAVWVALLEVSVMNFVLVVLWAFAMPCFRFRPIASCLSTVWCCIMIVCKMLYQLKIVDPFEYSSNCTKPNSTNLRINEIDNSTLYKQPVDPANWFGFRKGFPILGYMQNHLLVLLLLAFEVTVYRHQEHYRRSHRLVPPATQTIFEDVSREKMDQGVVICAKYLINYFFYKFGLEVCFLMTVNVIGQRMNFMVIFHGCWLMVIMLRRRREAIAKLWPKYCCFLVFFLLYQYLLCVGIPPALCIDYPWRWESFFMPINSALIKWMYFPDYFIPPNSRNLMSDFLLLLCVSQQWKVFADEKKEEWIQLAGENRDGPDKLKEKGGNPVPNFVNCRSYLDMLKVVVFRYQFWFVLAVIFITGATRISMFGLGYLLACFYLLLFGNSLLQKPVRTKLLWWDSLILFNVTVVISKNVLSLLACVFVEQMQTSYCWAIQLFSLVCTVKGYYSPIDLNRNKECLLPVEEAGIIWDSICFFFLLLQRRVFLSYYFLHVVADLKASSLQASRGFELFKASNVKDMQYRKEEEKKSLEQLKRQMKQIRAKQQKYHDGRLDSKGAEEEEPIEKGEQKRTPQTKKTWWRPWLDHATVIHAGEYYLFESDSEEEAETLAEEQKTPRQSAFQLAYEAWVTNAKSALRQRREHQKQLQKIAKDQQKTEEEQHLLGEGESKESLEVLSDEAEHEPEKNNVVQRILDILKFLFVLFLAMVDGLTQWLNALTKHYVDTSAVLWIERYVLTQTISQGQKLHRGILDDLYSKDSPTAELPSEATALDESGMDKGAPSQTSITSSDGEEPFSNTEPTTSLTTGYDSHTNSEEHIMDLQCDEEVEFDKESLQQLAHPTNSTRTASELLASRIVFVDELEESEKFYQNQNRFLKLLFAVYHLVAAHSDLVCYFIIVLNNMVTASVISVVLPILIFLWAMLSIPRPSKRFWMTAIVYTEVMIILKYLFQFGFFPWNSSVMSITNDGKPYFPPRILGLEKMDNYIKYDLIQLMILFFHRSLLRRYGLWDDEEDIAKKKKKQEKAKMKALEREETSYPEAAKDNTEGDMAHETDLLMQDAAVTSASETKGVRQRFRRKKKDAGAPASDKSVKNENRKERATKQLKAIQEKTKSIFLTVFQNVYRPIHRFFQDMLNTKNRAATDVYAPMFLADVVDFVIIVFGFWAFGKYSAATDIASSLSENQVPEAFLVMLLIQFSTMVIDRALYLHKTVFGKLVFQVILVIGIHIWMFFILPAVTERMFSRNTVAQLWYFVKCIYFALSAYQIRCGYPTRVLGNFLTKKYNHLNLFLFQGFRLVPFLVELRAVMDWVCTDTTLSLSNWMCVEDIYANIFIIKCSRETEKKYPQPKGQKKKKIVKYGMGGLIILFLVGIIWFPLLFMSLVRSVVGVVNHPIDVTVSLKLGGYEPLFTMSAQQQSIKPFTETDYEKLTKEFQTNPSAMQFITLYSYEDIAIAEIEGSSGSLWSISPPSREQMIKELKNSTANMTLRFTWKFQRNLALGGTVEYTSEKYNIELEAGDSARTGLADLLLGTYKGSVVIPHLFPKYIRAPNAAEANPINPLHPENEKSYLSVTADLMRKNTGEGNTTSGVILEWWVMKVNGCQAEECNILPMVIFSDKVSPPSLGFLAGYGIMGLYVSIVLVIGKFVRGFFSEISHSIMFEELPCVDRILKLCKDIFLVRERGELELEEELYAKLIFLYRSPETMIKWTREKE
ncbi:piezo-type mechanosensitive ion channel component 1 [Protopterus annectens]|uniref:piezo-type mechanosensitive ion channel component 1 n=1 Tax=Protopterus annectens TaxID=7888 RepID=UPI001CFBEFA1|nr:piezo-type mechanosensitive ion channel component 1 [Protopterus annectens]